MPDVFVIGCGKGCIEGQSVPGAEIASALPDAFGCRFFAMLSSIHTAALLATKAFGLHEWDALAPGTVWIELV